MEQSKLVQGLKSYWFVFLFVGGLIIQWAEQRKDTANLQQAVQSLENTVKTLNKVIEEKVAKEAARLDDEDDGVRGDMNTADEELHNDIEDLKEYENLRERALTAEMKLWFYQTKQ